MQIMKKRIDEITTRQYQMKRYQAAGKGAMCQSLNAKLHKLMKKQSAA